MSETPFKTTIASKPPPGPPAEVATTGGEIIVRMYRGALRHISEAGVELGRSQETGSELSVPSGVGRARAIIQELRTSLDYSVAPGLCQSLERLYEYIIHELDCCAEDGDVRHLESATGILTTLLEAWEEVIGVPSEQRVRRAS